MTLPLRIDKEEGIYLCPECGQKLNVLVVQEYITPAIAPARGESRNNDFGEVLWDQDYWCASPLTWNNVFCPACGWTAKNHAEIEAAVLEAKEALDVLGS